MKSTTFIAIAAALCFVVSAAPNANPKSVDPATDISNPIYKNLALGKDEQVVRIKPIGEDTVLEEGPESEIEAKHVSGEDGVLGAKPVAIHELDSVNLPDAEIEAPAVKLADVKIEAEPKQEKKLGGSMKTYFPTHYPKHFPKHCPKKCQLNKHSCPHGCHALHCVIRQKYPYQQKYIVRVKYTQKLRRHVLVNVKTCFHGHGHHYSHKCSYFFKPVYKWVTYYVTKYRTVVKYKTAYKYTYKTGLKCFGF